MFQFYIMIYENVLFFSFSAPSSQRTKLGTIYLPTQLSLIGVIEGDGYYYPSRARFVSFVITNGLRKRCARARVYRRFIPGVYYIENIMANRLQTIHFTTTTTKRCSLPSL